MLETLLKITLVIFTLATCWISGSDWIFRKPSTACGTCGS